MSKQENRKDGTAREESFGALEQAMPQSGGDMGDTMAFTPLGKQAEKQQPAQAAGRNPGNIRGDAERRREEQHPKLPDGVPA